MKNNPETINTERLMVVAHELDSEGTAIRSIALSEGMLELLPVFISLAVFTMVIRFIFRD